MTTGRTPTPTAPPPAASPDAAAPVASPRRAWPETRREAVSDTIHGVVVADPYRWLERDADPEVQAWTAAQDEHARAAIAKLPDFTPTLELLRSVYYYEATSEPIHRKGRYFYTRRLTDRDRRVVYWKKGERGAERVLLDPNTWTRRSLGEYWPSPDGRLVAYTAHENAADEATLKVWDVDAGTDLPDVITGLKWTTPSWTPDGKAFYYRWLPPPGTVPETERRGYAELRLHVLGTDPARDAVMFPATRITSAHLDGFVSHDGHWLFATLKHGWTKFEIHVRDLRKKRSTWRPLVTGVEAMFQLVPWKDRFYVRTNDAAPRYRVLRVDPAHPDRKDWKEIVPPRADATLQRLDVIGKRLVLTYLKDASTQIAIHDLDGKWIRNLDLPPLGTADGITGNPDEDTGYVSYTSYTEPGVVWKTSLRTGALTELSRIKLPVDTRAYTAEQVWFPSRDGTKVSMFIVHKRDVTRSGRAPTILIGYGGFAESMSPEFAVSRVAWLEAGGVLAIANLRGGGEYGEEWHRAAMAEHKQRTIDDMIAAARHLIEAGWTSSAHLGLFGGSNGGLVATAAMTQTPALVRAVVALVPLTDMVRYHKFGHASAWIPEYGSADDPVQFAALHAYSPYHRVTPGTAYPALLVLTSDHDDRVVPMHARKIVAAVQNATTGDAPVLLRVDREAGHGGTDSVRAGHERSAAIYSFLLAQLR